MAILAYDDVMLREPRLLVPRQSPLSRVAVNRNHPFGNLLSRGWVLNGSMKEICGNSKDDGSFVNGTAAYFSPCRYGMAAYLDGANPGTVIAIGEIGAPPVWSKNRDFTIAAIAIPEVLTGNASRRALFCMGQNCLQIGLTTAGQINCSDSQVADIGTTAGISAATVGDLAIVTASIDAANAVKVYLNGQLGLSTTYTDVLNVYTGTNRPILGAESHYLGNLFYEEFKGWFLSAFYFSAAFSPGQHAAFYADPYQFLIPA